MKRNNQLLIAGCSSILASIFHICFIFGGSDWYLFFGAGERMAQLAAEGDSYPTIITLVISSLLAVWGLYAFSGAGLILKLPFIKTCLVIITVFYLVRGIAGLIVPFVTTDPMAYQNSIAVWIIGSVICCIIGVYYLLGTLKLWRSF
ncbi:hypothetical protein [Paraglaciecola sp.]|uniref:hypothetical protein n=1 Tax=Paraglaciecola sp. TaxID=1920173 RepID=UPI0030F3E6D6